MKCRAWVVIKQRTRRGKAYPYVHLVGDDYERQNWGSLPEEPKTFKLPKPKGATRCGGDLTARVRLVEDPGWGYTDTKLDITITCARCKSTYHGDDLAKIDETLLSVLLTDHLARLPEPTSHT